MSEGAPVHGVLVGHGGMPAGMVDAVQRITGCEPDALVPLSNRGLSPDALAEEVVRLLGVEPAILFTDLQSGSCGFVAQRLARTRSGLVVISGVNLPLLIDFVMNRQQPLEQLVPRLLARGRAAMGCAPASLDQHERPALPR
jgi:N-acetylgalactosamine PTS system EIIA component